jgi:hypothetical protein
MTWTRNGNLTNCDDDRAMEGLRTSEQASVDGQTPGGGGTTRRARTGMRGLGKTIGGAYLAQVNVRLTDEDLTALHNACLRLKTSASAFARLAIRTQMESMEADTK